MKKFIPLLILILISAGCMKMNQPEGEAATQKAFSTAAAEMIQPSIGWNKPFDLSILEADATLLPGEIIGVQNPRAVRLRTKTIFSESSNYLGYPVGIPFVALSYQCPIYNSGPNDFVVDKSESGLFDSVTWGGSYKFNHFLQIKTYKLSSDGWIRIDSVIKENFDVENSMFYPGFDVTHYYAYDTMYVSVGGVDLYTNYVQIPSHDLIADAGTYCVIPTVDPLENMSETDFENNYARLPVVIGAANSIVIDNSVLVNKVAPVKNISYVKNMQGKTKTVTISWQSTIDEVDITVDGITKEVYGNSYTITVPGSWKSSAVSIVAKVDGVPNSNPVSIIIKK